MSALAPLLQAFFTDRLIRQLHASDHTIAAYRDTWRLLLGYATDRTGRAPSRLDIADLDVETITGFLDHLEQQRHNSVRTRNARLAAIHSLFAYAALHHPEHGADIQRVLAIPTKRSNRPLITHLTDDEVDALLAAPDRGTWAGRRDHALLCLAIQTGLRVSELIALTRNDLHLGTTAYLACRGKGRKDRIAPVNDLTRRVLRAWLAEQPDHPTRPLFPTRTGGVLSRDAVEHRITLHATRAAQTCMTLRTKHVTAHVLRHTFAMRLLHAGTDTSVIALLLGHEQVATTGIYLDADLELKERALARTTPPHTKPERYRAPDTLIAFLDTL
jgi:integrase/recombinase XerD